MSRKILSIIVILTTVIIASCKHDTTPPIIDPSTIPSQICFTDDILPLVQSNCAMSGCHSGKQNPNLSSYAYIMKLVKPGDAQGSKLYQYAIGSTMPPRPNTPLNLAQVTLLYGWIERGAKNDTCPCDTTFTFTAVNNIIQNACIGCHGKNSANGVFMTYQQIYDKADAILGRITAQTGSIMPQYGKLSDCKINEIRNWINDGKPNN